MKGGKFFGYKNVPLLRFYILSAGVDRPGELSSPRRANLLPLFFFLRGILTMSPPPLRVSVLPNLNLLKLELGVDYLFKTNNSKRNCERKGYWAALQRRPLLV